MVDRIRMVAKISVQAFLGHPYRFPGEYRPRSMEPCACAAGIPMDAARMMKVTIRLCMDIPLEAPC
jgi:hypothetical protein